MDDEDGTIELDGRKFGANDDGAPMLCNLVCKEMGRHVHVDYCRAPADGACQGEGVLHIQNRMRPDPDASKDWISHKLFWRRTGEFSTPLFSTLQLSSFARRFQRYAAGHAFSGSFLNTHPDPYSKEDQTNFAKW